MGNIHAASAPSSFPSGFGAPPPSPPLTAPPPTATGTPEKILPTPAVENPGTFEELHKKCKGMTRITINALVQNYYIMYCTLSCCMVYFL